MNVPQRARTHGALPTALCINAAAGFAIMSLEVTAARILAPYMGTSAAVWTGIIGVILGSLAVGSMLGGRWADTGLQRRTISGVLLLAALIILIVSLTEGAVLTLCAALLPDIRLQAVVGTAVLFAVPSALLGAVSPLAFRLALTDLDHSGRVAGRMSAAATIGSLGGTFFTGFYLLSAVGCRRLLIGTALLCGVAALLLDREEKLRQKLGITIISLYLLSVPAFAREKFMGITTVVDRDTQYQRALVIDAADKSKREIRALVTDPLGYQSIIYKDAPQELFDSYLQFFDIAFALKPDARRVLLCGGGAFTYPKHLKRTRPEVRLDVIELDPVFPQIAAEHFSFVPYENLHIHFGDARVEVKDREPGYDVVFMDAFSAAPSIPFHLVTAEAFKSYRDVLASDGILVSNLIASTTGPSSGITRAIVKTLREVFPQVEVFCTLKDGCSDRPQNILILAFKEPKPFPWDVTDPLLKGLLDRRADLLITESDPLLTDDYAPVEWLMLPVLRGLRMS